MDFTGMTFPEIFAIIQSDAAGVDRAIKERNARFSLAIAKALQEDEHDPKGCKVKQCPHGDPELVTGHIEHAAVLFAEAQEME